MPFTPYHVGPSGLVGLLFRRWLDVPVFVLANVLIDVEVLADCYFEPGWPVHQIWHFHTLLVGSAAGAVFGLCIYYCKPLRWCCCKLMEWAGLPGKTTPLSMMLAGALGAGFHVLVDSMYHYDVQIFWPYPKNPVIQWLRHWDDGGYAPFQRHIRLGCVVCWVLMIGLYGLLRLKTRNTRTPAGKTPP